MNRRQNVEGMWIDLGTATLYEEGSRHDGSNFISLATGSQWHHEALYQSARGAWVLNAWSAEQGSTETWEVVSPKTAAAWLVKNEKELPECLEAVAKELEL
jgi:hypothetical protein